ncbi:hypothetical protein C8R43DRAFT_950971 [Mycena crocata]|nr:hypothetical protein C8R43DRAFT_950971 [Mycena crocata]
MKSPVNQHLNANYVPTDAEIELIRGHLGPHESELARLESQISHLCAQRDQLKIYVDSHKALTSQARRIPQECAAAFVPHLQHLPLRCVVTAGTLGLNSYSGPIWPWGEDADRRGLVGAVGSTSHRAISPWCTLSMGGSLRMEKRAEFGGFKVEIHDTEVSEFQDSLESITALILSNIKIAFRPSSLGSDGPDLTYGDNDGHCTQILASDIFKAPNLQNIAIHASKPDRFVMPGAMNTWPRLTHLTLYRYESVPLNDVELEGAGPPASASVLPGCTPSSRYAPALCHFGSTRISIPKPHSANLRLNSTARNPEFFWTLSRSYRDFWATCLVWLAFRGGAGNCQLAVGIYGRVKRHIVDLNLFSYHPGDTPTPVNPVVDIILKVAERWRSITLCDLRDFGVRQIATTFAPALEVISILDEFQEPPDFPLLHAPNLTDILLHVYTLPHSPLCELEFPPTGPAVSDTPLFTSLRGFPLIESLAIYLQSFTRRSLFETLQGLPSLKSLTANAIFGIGDPVPSTLDPDMFFRLLTPDPDDTNSLICPALTNFEIVNSHSLMETIPLFLDRRTECGGSLRSLKVFSRSQEPTIPLDVDPFRARGVKISFVYPPRDTPVEPLPVLSAWAGLDAHADFPD